MMASLEVLTTQKDLRTFEINDYSLLAEVEIPVTAAQKKDANVPNNDNFNFTNMQSALTSGTLPDSSVEVHSQMSELIEENNRLKDMLNESNLELEDFKKAKEKISSLENENSELQKKLVDMEQKAVQGPDSCIKCTTLDTGLKNMLGMDYIEDNQALLVEWSYFRENLFGNLKYICQQLEEISKSKKTLEEKTLLDAYALMLKFKIAFLRDNGENAPFASLRSDEETGFEVVHLKARQDPVLVEELRKNINDKNREIICLKEEREKYLKKIEEYELKVQKYEAALNFQCELLQHELQVVQSSTSVTRESTTDSLLKNPSHGQHVPEERSVQCDGCHPDAFEHYPHVLERLIEKWKQQMKKCELKLEKKSERMSDDQVIQELQEEILNLEVQLKIEQQANKAHKQKMTDIMIKCEKLQVDYERVTKILEMQSRDEKKKDLILKEMKAEKKRLLEESDHITAKLISVQEELDKKHADARKIQNRSDQDKKLHSPLYQGESSDQRNRGGEVAGSILCPICNMAFPDEHKAQKHVNRCLEENK